MKAELNYLNKKQEKGLKSKSRLKQDSITWKSLIKKYSYPRPVFDSMNKTCKYEFIIPLDSLEKQVIYNRVLEYLTIKYNYLGDVILYEDSTSGRLIVKLKNKGLLLYKSDKIIYEYILKIKYSIIDNKLKISILYISYKKQGSYNHQSLFTSFPISKSEEYTWEKNLAFYMDLEKDIKEENLQLVQYIKSYKNDIEF
jgi:hypothetical protein